MQHQTADGRCPRCRLINLPHATRCECGWDLLRGNAAVFRSGDTVVTEDCGTLPARCIKCNAPASEAPLRYTFVDSAVGGAPRGVFSAISHFSTRRTGRVFINLCGRHRRLRTVIRWGCPLLMLLGVAVGVYANVAFPKLPPSLINTAAALTAGPLLILAIYQQHYVKGRLIGREIWVDGAGKPFLESLPTERPSA